MRRLHALIVIVFCIHLEQNCVNPHPDVCQEEFYIPAFEGDPQVPKQLAFDGASQVSRKQLPKKLNWIDAQIQDELIPLSDNAAQAFQSRISEICELKITIDQVKLIVTQILEPLETPTYLDILPKTCSALITATVPYLVDDPFCRILTGFQNYKGNDAYLEAALSNHKERLYHLSRVVGQNYDRPNKDGITALLAACHSCNYYELKRILKATTTISHDRRDPLGRTALHLLAQHCHSGRLFRRSPVLSADHQSIATIDETASTTDSQNSDPASNPVEYLLRKAPHFDENIRNHDGDTVLHMACRDLDPCLVNVLLKRETIDITIPDCQGQTALDILLENGKMATSVDDNAKFARCLAAFIIKGAHVNAAERFGSDGNTVLHLMCLLECVAALNKLLESRPKETNLMNKYDQTPFQIAFKKDGNRIGSMTRSFIENGCADVVVQLDRGDTILHLACRDRDLSTVKLLMGYPLAQVNHKNQLSQTPLHIVYMSKVGMVTGPLTAEDIDDDYADRHVLPKTEALIMETLLGNSNTDPNVRDFQGDALIHLACRKSDYETVSTLMKFKRTIVNLMGRHGQTPIQIAFDMENLSKIRGDCLKCEGDSICPNRSILCLLLRNQEVSPVVKSEGTTLLHLACEYSNSAAIRLLLNNKNTAVDALDYSLRTPLKYTTLRDCRDRFRISQIMRQLLESQRINPNEPINDAEDTLLHLACRHGDVEAIRFLLTLPNITMNARSKNGKTPLQLAYAYDQRSEAGLRAIKPYIGELTTAILGGPNPDCNAPLDQSSNTILHLLTESYYSCSLKQQPALRSLIKRIISERMANPNLTNRDGLRPLETVYKNEKLGFLENGSKGLLKIFLDSEDFDPNVPLRDVHGCSLLHVACAESNAPAVKALLKHRSIDIMVPDNYGFIPFKVACDVDRETNGEQNLSAKQIVHELFTAGKNLLNETGMALLLKILEENIRSNQSKN